MSQPNYKLKDDHVATVKHMRDERARNEDTYDKKTDLLRIQRLVGVTSAIDAVEFNANGNNAVIKKYGVRENGLLAYDQVPAWQNVTSLADTKANSSDVYNRTEVNNALALKRNVADSYTKTETDNALATKLNLSGGTMTGNLNTGGNRLIQTYNP